MNKRRLLVLIAMLLYVCGMLAACENKPEPQKQTEESAMNGLYPWHPAEDDELNILMVGNSFCYYYVEELYGMLTAAGCENVNIYNLYYSGCRLDQHYNWWKNGEAKYELYKTDAGGRLQQTSATGTYWTLEDALRQGQWDYISLQGASTGVSYANENAFADSCAKIVQYAEPLLDHFNELFPYAQLLWHRTWAFEVGRISGETVYDADLNAAYDAGMQAVCDYMCNEFDKGQPYDLKMVNSGAAWAIARAEDAKLETSLLPIGGLCARNGIANANTYQYVKDNPSARNVGDAYHDGDIGGGQFLNACVWFETITGQSCIGNTYRPDYPLDETLIGILQAAAHQAVTNTAPEAE